MKRFFKYLIIFIICSSTAFLASAQSITVNAKLDKAAMPIGDQTKLHLTIRFPVKDSVSFPKIIDNIAGKLQIVNVAKADTTFDKNDISIETIHRSYTITGFDTGQYIIPQYEFKTKTGVFKTQEQVLQILPVKVDTTKGVYDIKQPIAVSYSRMEWLGDNWPKVVFPILAVLVIIGLIIYMRKRPKKEILVKAAEPEKPAHVIALNKLYALRNDKLWQQGQVKQYYSEISDIMRNYLEKRYQIKANEQTTDEIFSGIRHLDITEADRNTLRQVLVLADLVKFAKEKPLAAENEHSVNNAIDFVLKTQKAEQPVLSHNVNKGGHQQA